MFNYVKGKQPEHARRRACNPFLCSRRWSIHLLLMCCLWLVACSPEGDPGTPDARAESPPPQANSASLDANPPAIDMTNSEAVLALVFDVFAGQVYDERYFSLQTLLDDLIPDTTEYILRQDDDYYVIKQFSCADEGTATLEHRYENNGEIQDHQLAFDNCLHGLTRHNGDADLLDMTFGEQRYDYRQMTITDARGGRTILSGHLQGSIMDNRIPTRWLAVEGVDLETRMSDGESLILSDATHYLKYGNFCPKYADCLELAGMGGTFRLKTSLVADHDLVVATPIPFYISGSSQRRFDTGELTIEADDGSGLRILADNGVLETFTVTLLANDDLGASYELPWATFEDRLTLP